MDKVLYIVVGHPNTESSIDDMFKLVSTLKNADKEILVSCHCEIPQKILDVIDYSIVDPNNPEMNMDMFNSDGKKWDEASNDGQNGGFSYQSWNEDIWIHVPSPPGKWHVAALINYRNGLKFAIENGYDSFVWLEADNDISEKDVPAFDEILNQLHNEDKRLFATAELSNANFPTYEERLCGAAGLGAEIMIGESRFVYDTIQWVDTVEKYTESCNYLFQSIPQNRSYNTYILSRNIESYIFECFVNKDRIKYCMIEGIKSPVKQILTKFPNSIMNQNVIENIDPVYSSWFVVEEDTYQSCGVYISNNSGRALEFECIFKKIDKSYFIDYDRIVLDGGQWPAVIGGQHFKNFNVYDDSPDTLYSLKVTNLTDWVCYLNKRMRKSDFHKFAALNNKNPEGRQFPITFTYQSDKKPMQFTKCINEDNLKKAENHKGIQGYEIE